MEPATITRLVMDLRAVYGIFNFIKMWTAEKKTRAFGTMPYVQVGAGNEISLH